MKVTRRKSLKLAASAVAAPLATGGLGQFLAASAQPGEALTQAELDALDVMVAEQGTMAGTYNFEAYQIDKQLRGQIVRNRIVPALRGTRKSKDGVVLAASTVADANSPNYNHLRGLGGTEPFKLSAAVLERMADANSFTASFEKGLVTAGKPQARIVIFGLRGCRLAPDATSGTMLDEVSLVEAPIDHRSKNCVMGVWDRKAKKVSAFTATTVPHMLYMQMYRINLHLLERITLDDATVGPADKISAEEKDKRELPWTANMLGQGLHMMEIGKHQGTYPNLLVQHMRWFGPVLRASTALGYTVKDWDRSSGRVGDNIHPCWPVPGWLMDFASAGCNLIEGESKTAPDYDGPFAVFLKQIKQPSDALGGLDGNWKAYYYMLLSGREARLHAKSEAPDPTLKRLRFGSSGPDVADLQKRGLGLSAAAADGIFGLATHRRALSWQDNRNLPTDGVFTPDLLNMI